jgi:hypothetical protein
VLTGHRANPARRAHLVPQGPAGEQGPNECAVEVTSIDIEIGEKSGFGYETLRLNFTMKNTGTQSGVVHSVFFFVLDDDGKMVSQVGAVSWPYWDGYDAFTLVPPGAELSVAAQLPTGTNLTTGTYTKFVHDDTSYMVCDDQLT